MTDRTRGPTAHSSPQEAIDLNELHAAKPGENPTDMGPANTDLASASIQSISVVRLSARPEKRKVGAARPTLETETKSDREPRSTTRSTSRGGEKHGVFKNPYFPYEGNLLERFVTLLANLLKVFELSVLRSLKPPPPPTTKPKTVVARTKRRGPDGRDLEDDDVEATEEEKPQHMVTPRRE